MTLPFHNKLLHCYFELARNKLSYIAKLLKLKSNVTISASSFAVPDISEERLWHLPRRPADIKQFNNLTIKRGFSLVELLVVISIIAILVAAGTASYTNAQQKGRDGKRKSDLKAVQQALEQYFQQNGKYPNRTTDAANSTYVIRCNAGTDLSVIYWGNPFVCNSITYMQKLPKDPIGTPGYPQGIEYNYRGLGGSTYTLWGKLENTNDSDLLPANQPCTASSPWNYCVVNP